VESVLAQKGVRLELIVVNDGSTDETQEILNRVAESDARVRILDQENAGITVALIRGCAIAKGKYIARQDAGDWSLSGRLERQVAALEADGDLSFVSCWTEVCGPCEEFISTKKGSGRATVPTNIISDRDAHDLVDGPSCHPSVVFRRDSYQAVGGYRNQFYFGQDWDLWYRLAECGKFQVIPAVLYRTRVTPESLSGRYRDAQNQVGKLSREALSRRRRGQDENDLLERASAIRPGPGMPTRSSADGYYFIGECLRRNGDERAEIYLKKAISAAPTDLRSWVRFAQIAASRAFRRPHRAKRS
jgi:glycosyltransferase involved in cell wall biosynthesis